jgi:hypothetical protein
VRLGKPEYALSLNFCIPPSVSPNGGPALPPLDPFTPEHRPAPLRYPQVEGQRLRSFGLWHGTCLARQEHLLRRRHLRQLQADAAALAVLARNLGRGAFRAAVVSEREAVRANP